MQVDLEENRVTEDTMVITKVITRFLRMVKSNFIRSRNIIKRIILLGLCVQIFLLIRVYYEPEEGHVRYIHQLFTHTSDPLRLKPTLVYKKLNYDTSPTWLDDYTYKGKLLTISHGPNKGETLDDINELEFYDNDPRLVWTVLLDHIMNESPESIDFSWYDWANYHQYNNILSLSDDVLSKINCDLIYSAMFEKDQLEEIEAEIGQHLFETERVKYNEQFWVNNIKKAYSRKPFDVNNFCHNRENREKFQLPIEVKSIKNDMRPEKYTIQMRAYLLESATHNPLSLTVLNEDNLAYQFPVKKDNKPQNLMQSGLLPNFIEKKKPEDNFIFDHTKLYKEFIKNDQYQKYRVDVDGTDKSRLDELLVELNENDFLFNPIEKIKDLESRDPLSLTVHQKQYLDSLKYSVTIDPMSQPKYFTECKDLVKTIVPGSHRDSRFLGLTIDVSTNNYEYQTRLNAMIRTFLKFTRANGLISWLAHGTLYGHLYNGLAFPWDDDFDLQMPINHLNKLAEYFNQTLVLEDPREGNGRFLMDFTSAITVRSHGNGNNNIDARFIDIDTGIYIDITGLSVSSETIRSTMKKYMEEDFDPDTIEKTLNYKDYEPFKYGFNKENITEIRGKLRDRSIFTKDQMKGLISYHGLDAKRPKANDIRLEQGVPAEDRFFNHIKKKMYNCRNGHFVQLDALSPLYNSMFHSVPALTPRKPIEILNNEYKVPKNFQYLTFQGKVFLPGLRSWFTFVTVKNVMKLAMDKILPLPLAINEIMGIDHYFIIKGFAQNSGYDIMATLYNTFEATSFRVKEMEIMYDPELSFEEVVGVFENFRKKSSKTLKNPFKDPLLYLYERNLFNNLVKQYEPGYKEYVLQKVTENSIMDVWHQVQSILEKTCSMFLVENEDGKTINLNYIGINYETEFSNQQLEIFDHDNEFIEKLINYK